MERAIHEPTRRAPAVAGSFYPASAPLLSSLVDELLGAARARRRGLAPCRPKALIVPHAGYLYSGPVAASAYALLPALEAEIARVVVVGPAHHVFVGGLAAPGAALLCTPLGEVVVDQAAVDRLHVASSARAHAPEHSIEVQLPFLQRVLPRARVVPLLVSDAPPAEVGLVLEALWGGGETLVVVSSDLSHYRSYSEARELDASTAERIVELDAEPLPHERACGAAAINGLLWVARRRRLVPRLLDLRTSGDTAGPRERVVGYGAFAFEEPPPVM